jgi:uncharacterized membrane protein
VGLARESVALDLAPEQAFELWTDLRRWPSFIDGFARVIRTDESWPHPGAKITWESIPGGRGTVTEKVTQSIPGAIFATQVLEEALTGTQTMRFELDEENPEGTFAELDLDYELTQAGRLGKITDFLFIRRAQSDALRRTLRRFAIEAADQASL